MISRDEVLMGRIKYEDLSAELKTNLDTLLVALNAVRAAYGKPLYVSSGYRSPQKNASIGGAKKSHHMTCKACDFKDPDGAFDKWCLENQDLFEKLGLWLENPDKTVGWVHIDTGIRDTKIKRAHKRVFNP